MRIFLLILICIISESTYSQKVVDIVRTSLVNVIESKKDTDIYNYAHDTLYPQLEHCTHVERESLEKSLRFYADSTSLNKSILLACVFEVRTNSYDNSNITEHDKLEIIEELISEYENDHKLKSPDSSRLKSLYNFRGKSLYRLGYLKKALRSYTTSLTYSLENTVRNIEPTIPIRLRLKQLDNLEVDIKMLLEQFRAHDQILYIGKTQFYLVEYYLLTNQTDKVRELIPTIDTRYIKHFSGLYYHKLAHVYKNLGEVELEEQALQNQLLAVESNSRYPNSINQQIELADFYLRNNNLTSSNEIFQRIRKELFINESEKDSYIDIGAYVNTLIGLSEISFINNDSLGLLTLNESLKLIKEKFNNLQFQEDKLNLTKNYKKIISLKIRHRKLLKISNEELFSLAEESKAIALLDELVLNKTIESTLNPVDFHNWVNLKDKIFATEENIKKLSNKESEYSRLKEQINNRKHLVQTQERLFEEYDFKATDISNQKYKQQLNPNQQVLEYFVYDTTAILIAKTLYNTKVYDIRFNSQTQQNVLKLKNLILKQKNKQLLDSLSREITNIILPPKLKINQELMIIPDGILSYIPFECLMTQSGKYLIEETNISYNYSMNILSMMSEKSVKSNITLACSPKYYSSIKDFPFEDLENNLEESLFVESLSSNTIHLKDKSATKAKFLQYIQNTKLLHFAGHADINSFDIGKSYLAFSDYSGQVDSTLLFLNELYNLKLETELIVLSACNTGMGSLIDGEGILSLARGFIYAGTKSVLSSLWKVNDSSTKEIMINFYEFLSKGHPKDKALTLAKRKYLTENGGTKQHPYYWAGFVLIGDTSPICSSYSNLYFYTLILIGLFLVAFYFFKKKRASA